MTAKSDVCRKWSKANSEFSEAQLEEMKKVFSVFDKNGDGKIVANEFCAMMKMLGQDIGEDKLQDLLKKVDTDDSGAIELDEFMKMVSNLLEEQPEMVIGAELLNAFQMFDKDGNGYISNNELKEGLESFGETLSDDQIAELIKEVDTDGDGKVNYKEFARMMFVWSGVNI